MKPLSSKKRNIYFIICIIIFLSSIPFIILYAVGYRLDKTLTTFKTGAIFVQTEFAGVNVSVDELESKRTSLFQKYAFLDNLKTGEYVVSSSKEGYQPWQQTLLVFPEQVSQTFAFILPSEIPYTEIIKSSTTTAEDYVVATALFKTATTTSTSTEIISGKTGLSFEKGSGLIVEWLGQIGDEPYYFCIPDKCVGKILIPAMSVKDFDFFPNRTDVIIVSQGKYIYAQQIDGRDMPEKQIIYNGTSPEFRLDDEILYIKDNNRLFKILL